MVTTLNTALRFELVGQEALVHDPAGGLVVRLTGDEHSVIDRLTNGEQIVDPTEGEQAAIDRLVEAGIVLQDDSSSSKFSRRRVMQLSAAGVAAAGLTYLVLPGAAAAASAPPDPGYDPPGPPIPPLPSGAIPGATSLDISDDVNVNLEVRWRKATGSVEFDYVWAVYAAGSRTATTSGTANTAAGFVDAGVGAVTGQIVRFFVGSQVVDRPVTV